MSIPEKQAGSVVESRQKSTDAGQFNRKQRLGAQSF
jgi:hypothetical protein